MNRSFGVKAFVQTLALAFVLVGTLSLHVQGQESAESREAMIERIGAEIEWFCTDELEGRGVQTKGIEIAADYIREEFKNAGLTSGVEDGSYYQTFTMPIRNSLAKDKCKLVLINPQSDRPFSLDIDSHYMPAQVGGSGELTAGLVFVGYGINSESHGFQEYDGVDVEGKIVVMFRGEPQEADDDSTFAGTETTEHSYIQTKVAAALENKAAGILFVNNPAAVENADEDELENPGVFGTRSMGIPVAHVKMEVINELLSANPIEDADGNSLDSLEKVHASIDENLVPLSQAMGNWECGLNFAFETIQIEASNVVGVIEGEGPLANETIVIGGHYDHLGYGGRGSRAPGRYEIHPGADDNATGTVAVLELARRYAAAESKPRRRLVFIAFSAEESGLIGSQYYVDNPLYDLDDTVAMINFDMIGRLRNNSLTLFGVTSGEEFRQLCFEAAEGTELDLTIPPSGFAGSDHLPFYRREIPDIFIHTGTTDVYHTPEDTFETINVPGAVEVIDFSDRLLDAIVNMSDRPTFVAAEPRRPRRSFAYFGAQPDFGSSEVGMYIRSVADESPAAAAGIQTGDVVLSIGGSNVNNQQQLFQVLSSKEPGDEVTVKLKRDDEEIEVKVTLGEARRGGRGNN